jgi:Rieske Fe-S protein
VGTHDGCALKAVTDGTINCPSHGSRYAVTEAQWCCLPVHTGLRTSVAVDGDRAVLLG